MADPDSDYEDFPATVKFVKDYIANHAKPKEPWKLKKTVPYNVMLISGHLETVGQIIDFMVGRVPEYYVEQYHQQPVDLLLEK